MLSPVIPKSRKITRIHRFRNTLFLECEDGVLRLQPKSEGIVRVSYAKKEEAASTEDDGDVEACESFYGSLFPETASEGIVNTDIFPDWEYNILPADSELDESLVLSLPSLMVLVKLQNGTITYCDGDGSVLLREDPKKVREMHKFKVFKVLDDGSTRTEKVKTADGEKSVITEAKKVEDGFLYHTRLHFSFSAKEALYGLGQHEEGVMDLRGKTIFGHQANRKIAVPMFVSTRGYGILTDTCSPFIFNDTEIGSYFYSEAVRLMDYYFISGVSSEAYDEGEQGMMPMDRVIAGYRSLTGPAAILPKWAYGYIQSQERYETQEEILEVAREYRERGLGLSCIVLDWMSWGDNMWGQKSFDESRFPDVNAMVDKLHGDDVHFMLSIWPNTSENTPDHKEFEERGSFLTGTGLYNAFEQKNRDIYWQQVRTNILSKGVDAFWCDSSEPITPEWIRDDRTEPAMLYGIYAREMAGNMPADLTNAFCLYHARTIWEGMRAENTAKRVCNLTRSGYTGGQRYGTILWSGDISASWDTLKKQIAAGVNFCASGLPYWTVDIGAFFVKQGIQWYWNGDYPLGLEDAGYRELFVRWYQWGAFLPVFRGHGTDVRRELWNFEGDYEGLPENAFYNALKKYNLLRYELLPYLYSLAGLAYLYGTSIMRPLAFEFSADERTHDIRDQYMLGRELMICPVTEPMYFEAGSTSLSEVKKTRTVYIPEGDGFYDFYTGKYYAGGQSIEVDAPLDVIPVFVKEGSILPMGNPCTTSVDAGKEITPRVFSKRNTSALFYEDAGDGYGYEKGEYRLTEYSFDAESGEVSKKELHSF